MAGVDCIPSANVKHTVIAVYNYVRGLKEFCGHSQPHPSTGHHCYRYHGTTAKHVDCVLETTFLHFFLIVCLPLQFIPTHLKLGLLHFAQPAGFPNTVFVPL